MNKAQLVEEIQKLLGQDASKACAERSLNCVLKAIAEGVKVNGKLQLIGFGTFSVSESKEREGVNPRTGEKIVIKASKKVKFKASSSFKAE